MPNVNVGEPTWVIAQADVLSRLSEGKLSQTLEDLAQKTDMGSWGSWGSNVET